MAPPRVTEAPKVTDIAVARALREAREATEHEAAEAAGLAAEGDVVVVREGGRVAAIVDESGRAFPVSRVHGDLPTPRGDKRLEHAAMDALMWALAAFGRDDSGRPTSGNSSPQNSDETV